MTRPAATTRCQELFRPLDAASLNLFRILFGSVLFADLCLYTRESIQTLWLEPKILFKYFGFEWVHLLPGDGMFSLVIVLRILAVLIALGFCYRAACAAFFLGFTYLFLVDQSEFLNHSYLICLLSFLMICIPAHTVWSVDAWRRKALRSDVVPTWTIWILRFQVGVVYVFAGLAKLTPDWLHGEPVRLWTHASEPTVYLICYGGLLFDLLIVPLLLVRRTRLPAFSIAVAFHLANAFLFDIGMFPWLMLVATTLFLDPSWPRALLRLPPVVRRPSSVISSKVLKLLAVYTSLQILIPLRHLLYPGDTNWTDECHRFSWRMKLRDKIGSALFFVTDSADGRTWLVDPVDDINPVQALRMAAQPDMILQFAHFLARNAQSNGYPHVEVRARVMESLNGRPPRPFVDPHIDLAAIPRSLNHATWIMPLSGTPTAMPLPTRHEEKELLVLARLVEEERDALQNLDRILRHRFQVDPSASYSFDADSRTIYDADGRALKKFAEKDDADEFLHVVTKKRLCTTKLAALKSLEAEKIEPYKR